jgi:polynucleotide 5'-kinase involved in rRNA processing
MKKINELCLGFSDAENYMRRENKELFNKIFVKNCFLDHLLLPSTYFLIGEKGTGKTAYSVFLTNNFYKNTNCNIKIHT